MQFKVIVQIYVYGLAYQHSGEYLTTVHVRHP